MPEEISKGMTAEDQKDMVQKDKEKLVNFWNLRNTQMQKDRDSLNIIHAPVKTDELKWYTNEAKVFFDTSRALVSLNPPKFRLPIATNPGADEKSHMNKAERLAVGIFRTLDQRLAGKGGVSWLSELAYWTLLGHYCVFAIVEKENGEPHFRADLIDPLNCYPEWDDKGLKKFVRSYEVDEITARMMAIEFQEKGLEFLYKSPEEGKRPNIINYWYRQDTESGKPKIWNAILLNGELAKPMTYQKALDHIPFHIGAVGSPDRTTTGWQERFGESILYANRDMYEYRNTMISLMATILAAQAFPNIIAKLINPNAPSFTAEDIHGYGSIVRIKAQEAIELFKNATTPQEAGLLMSWTGQKAQEASLPPTVYGSSPFEISGFALSQFMATLKYKLGSYLNAMQYTISRIMTDFLEQYRKGRYGKITLSTGTPADIRRGTCFYEEFSSEDVPDRTYVEVTIPISSQFDKTQQILNARQALQPPQIYSRETIWEMDGDVDDFEVEKERIRNDQVDNDQFMVDLNIIQGMWERYDELKTKNTSDSNIQAEALKRYIMMKELSMGMRRGIPEKSGGGMGIPSMQMPAEARESPDQLGAMVGKPPSGVNRRKQTPEERAGSQSGMIISPQGKVLI